MTKGANDLKWLLDHELKQAIRYRRYVSLVMLSAETEKHKLHKLLESSVRASDELFSFSNSIGILMGETDCTGALRAVERYQQTLKGTGGVRYSVACFPDDGKATEELMEIGQRRLKTAKALGYDTVVTKG